MPSFTFPRSDASSMRTHSVCSSRPSHHRTSRPSRQRTSPGSLTSMTRASETELGTLRGHLARPNPHSKALIESAQSSTPTLTKEVSVVFAGPRTPLCHPKILRRNESSHRKSRAVLGLFSRTSLRNGEDILRLLGSGDWRFPSEGSERLVAVRGDESHGL